LVLRGHKHWVTGTAVTPDGKAVASSSQDKTVRIWDPAGWDRVTGKGRITLRHPEEVNCVAFAPDGKILATGTTSESYGCGTGRLGSGCGRYA
jgi:WD40 repeat protein